jgi:hypothetical protein
MDSMADDPNFLDNPFTTFSKPSFRAKRLINFPTGKADLGIPHQDWLVQATVAIPPGRNYRIYIVGFASQLGYAGMGAEGSDAKNLNLSFQRANRSAQMMEAINPDISNHIEVFQARGNRDYVAAPTDDSPFWRAVEVHVFLDDPPPPPPELEAPPPCPGGRRYRKWSIATPAGFTWSPVPGAVVGANMVVLRRDEGIVATHYYIAPQAGGGVSYSGPSRAVGLIAKAIQLIRGSLSLSGMSWTPFTADTPFNFGDLDGATCHIASAGAGRGVGVQASDVSVSGQVWIRESSGKCMFKTGDFFTNVISVGKDLQFGIGGSAIGGPLIKVA